MLLTPRCIGGFRCLGYFLIGIAEDKSDVKGGMLLLDYKMLQPVLGDKTPLGLHNYAVRQLEVGGICRFLLRFNILDFQRFIFYRNAPGFKLAGNPLLKT